MSASKVPSDAASVDGLVALLAEADRAKAALSSATGVDCARLDLSQAGAQWSRPDVDGTRTLRLYLHCQHVRTLVPRRFAAVGGWVIADCTPVPLALRAANELPPASGDRLLGDALRRILDSLCCAFDRATPAACVLAHMNRPWRVLESTPWMVPGPRGSGADLFKVRVLLPAHGSNGQVELDGVVTDAGHAWELMESNGALLVLRRDLREEAAR